MKAQLMRISIGIVALGALLYFIACSPTPPSNNGGNQNQGVAPNQNQAKPSSVAADLDKPCDDYGSGHGTHSGEIKKEIEDKMRPSLKKLLKTATNPDGTFTVDVQKATNGKYYIAYVKGKISGDDNLKELSDILNDFQSKKDCLRMIYFMPSQTSVATDGGGFEWTSCEYPLVVCPNGECCQAIDTNANMPQASPTPGANTNANRP